MNHVSFFFSDLFVLLSADSRLSPSIVQSVKKQKIIATSTPSRWNTLEFKFYYLVVVVAVSYMFATAIKISRADNQNYIYYQNLLSDGWIFGRKVDNSDSQYRFFRDNFWLLSILAVSHLCLRIVFQFFISTRRNLYDLVFGSLVMIALYGCNFLKIFVHLLINYFIGRLFIYLDNKNDSNKIFNSTFTYKSVGILILWIYGISTLFVNDKFRSVRFGSMLSFLSPLDSFKGIIERWDVFFNFVLLKMLSFNLDYYNRMTEINNNLKLNTSKIDKSRIEIENPELLTNERLRTNAPLDLSQYSFSNYLSYVLYTPLFIAGPIITFNDFTYQSFHRLPTLNLKFVIRYAIRFVFCILTMELILHYIYVVAIAKRKAWINDTPFEISMIGFFNLNIIWLKLLMPWRFFRLWALLDGIDPPENMLRCVCNNYSALAFWRAWHRSFNKWILRYIYIPLGGSKSRILTSLAVFTFVAIWHDIQLRLLFWGWMIVLFLIPEILCNVYLKPLIQNHRWYRFICGIGAVVNIWLMMIANLFGFCLGNEGTKKLLSDMFTSIYGVQFTIISTICLFIAVQVMFELREHEKRHGVDVKC
ncbi:O-acyltransferase [Ascoidea rubescens DSM 1968]|uniref:MBOAT-domain-containing protein n=1 Tax=Ascoidea rubescens DSM 1968 TaxID=1344418 RepID=A0A1D2VIE0_9ASCO|nr:MBOAT-domain-containing protein [Ascoidea rubescens DSM 1968]ODV61416.1 MBOAT-domain-containing protein [Ascoidea rubescens DSM 1968]